MGEEATGRAGGLACRHPAREGQGWSESPGGCSPGASCTAPSSPPPLSSAPSSLPTASLHSSFPGSLWSWTRTHARNLHDPRAPAGRGSREGGAMSPASVGRLTTPLDHMRTQAWSQARCRLQTFCLLLYPLRQARKKMCLGEEGWGRSRGGLLCEPVQPQASQVALPLVPCRP